eukprot:gene6691-8010_t
MKSAYKAELLLRRLSSSATEARVSSTEDIRQAFGYCAQQVRRHDYEGYLCSLSLPKEYRAAAFAIRAFNVETVQAIENAKEPTLGLIRLQWWSSAVEDIYKKGPVPGQPVAVALKQVVVESGLNKRWLDRIIDARYKDAERTAPPKTLGSLEDYAENTASSMLYLQLEAAGVKNTKADHVASHVGANASHSLQMLLKSGKAIGLVNLLRGTPFHARRRSTMLPTDLMMKHGVATESVYRGEASEELCDVALAFASTAKSNLDKVG